MVSTTLLILAVTGSAIAQWSQGESSGGWGATSSTPAAPVTTSEAWGQESSGWSSAVATSTWVTVSTPAAAATYGSEWHNSWTSSATYTWASSSSWAPAPTSTWTPAPVVTTPAPEVETSTAAIATYSSTPTPIATYVPGNGVAQNKPAAALLVGLIGLIAFA